MLDRFPVEILETIISISNIVSISLLRMTGNLLLLRKMKKCRVFLQLDVTMDDGLWLAPIFSFFPNTTRAFLWDPCQKVVERLSSTISELEVYCRYKDTIDSKLFASILPRSLTKLKIGLEFSAECGRNLPRSLQSLSVYGKFKPTTESFCAFVAELGDLSHFEVVLGTYRTISFTKECALALPSSLASLSIDIPERIDPDFFSNLKSGIRHFIFGGIDRTSCPPIESLPPSVTHLTLDLPIGSEMFSNSTIPYTVKYLSLNRTMHIPQGVSESLFRHLEKFDVKGKSIINDVRELAPKK